jgi:hypothetical protein
VCIISIYKRDAILIKLNLKKMSEAKKINVLLLGETGTGKVLNFILVIRFINNFQLLSLLLLTLSIIILMVV